MKPTIPMGFGLEVFEASLLDEAYHKATEHFEHEHVTPYMYWKQTSLGGLPYVEDAHHFRVTLDTKEDYEAITAIYEALYQPGNTFTVQDVVAFLKNHPEIVAINKNVYQKKATD